MSLDWSKILMILGFVSHAAVKFSFPVKWKIKTLSLISMTVTTNLNTLTNQFNNMSSRHNDINSDDPGNSVSSKYYDAEEHQDL